MDGRRVEADGVELDTGIKTKAPSVWWMGKCP